ncbi:MAG TPA: TraR/DksA C4-type zinc finger protein [Planctomycetaceae bacterium]|nr:TraR/DksA C4-type zinc finger protein [Planctomycetaceae bacterium]
MARKDALLRLHERLITQRNALRRKLADERHSEYSSQASGGDIGDAANDGASNELNSQLAALESRELFQIERAIQMMRQGRYGYCEVCDQPIPIARLKALPFTLVCVDCQRVQEQLGGTDGEFEADWESAYEHEGRFSDRELTLGDLDLGE